MRKRYKLCVWAVFALVVLILSGAAGDRLDWVIWSIAPLGATNCGRVRAQDLDGQQATNCVLSAVRVRRPFRVRYDMEGLEEEYSWTMVGASDGHVHQYYSSTRPKDVVALFEVLNSYRCDEPYDFETAIGISGRDRGVISCIWWRQRRGQKAANNWGDTDFGAHPGAPR